MPHNPCTTPSRSTMTPPESSHQQQRPPPPPATRAACHENCMQRPQTYRPADTDSHSTTATTPKRGGGKPCASATATTSTPTLSPPTTTNRGDTTRKKTSASRFEKTQNHPKAAATTGTAHESTPARMTVMPQERECPRAHEITHLQVLDRDLPVLNHRLRLRHLARPKQQQAELALQEERRRGSEALLLLQRRLEQLHRLERVCCGKGDARREVQADLGPVQRYAAKKGQWRRATAAVVVVAKQDDWVLVRGTTGTR